MDVTMLLCDASEAVNGKLYILGGGWDHIWTPDAPANVSVAVLVAVPWNEANQKHALELVLVTEDGQPVDIGGTEVKLSGEFEVGRAPGIKPGSDLNTPLSFRLDGMALPQGGYVFELSIDGTVMSRRPFRVQLPPGQ